MNDLERRQARLRRARSAIRVELTVGFAAPVVVALVYIAAPGFTYISPLEQFARFAAPLAAVPGVIIGLAWMVRLSRPNPEPDQHGWRYRDR